MGYQIDMKMCRVKSSAQMWTQNKLLGSLDCWQILWQLWMWFLNASSLCISILNTRYILYWVRVEVWKCILKILSGAWRVKQKCLVKSDFTSGFTWHFANTLSRKNVRFTWEKFVTSLSAVPALRTSN